MDSLTGNASQCAGIVPRVGKNAANALMTANGTLHIPIQRKGVITVRAEGGAGVVLFFLLCKSKEAKISSLEVRYL